MANIKSAKKRILVNEKKSLQNKALKSSLKTAIKKADTAIASGKDADEAVRLAVKKIDQARSKGIIKMNTASRRKSSLARKLNGANTPA